VTSAAEVNNMRLGSYAKVTVEGAIGLGGRVDIR
jgi:hypothetical protein